MSEERYQYDTVISGGRVIDPVNGLSAVRDVAIHDGVIAAVEPEIAAGSARKTIDARGQIVTPGLIDLHTHIYWGATYWGVEPDPIAARSGVTTWIDVGSAGGYSFPGFREFVANRATARVYSLINLSSIGLIAPTWELANPDYWDVDLAAETVERNRDIILGIKIRIDARTTRGVGIEPLKRARELADRVGLPLMTHIGTAPPTIEDVIPYLRPGDILTHCFTWQDMGIFQEDGHVRPEIRDLQQQGLILDVGHGTGSFGYDVAEKMMQDGIMPDVISTDLHQMAVQGPTFDMPTTLSKFLNLGMSIEDVIARATINPAKAVHLDALGTLSPGKPADVSLFRIEEGDYTFYDVRMDAREGDRMLVSTATLVDGHELPRLEERELHFWAKLPEAQRPILRAAGPGVRVPDAETVAGDELLQDLHEQQEGE